MSSITLKKKSWPVLALSVSLLFLAACSGDGRGLIEEVEAIDLNLKSIAINPPVGMLNDLVVDPGTQLTFRITAKNTAESPVVVDSTNRRWTVENAVDTNGPAVARIDENGNLFALTEGLADVRVRIGGISSAKFRVTVEQGVLESIDSIVGVDTALNNDSVDRCIPKSYRANGRFRSVSGISAGTVRGLTDVEWSIDNTEFGSRKQLPNGAVAATGVNVGTLELRATVDGFSLVKSITVEDTLEEIRIGPENSGVQLGRALDLIATGRYLKEGTQSDAVITGSVQWLAEEGNDVLSVSNVFPTKGRVTTKAVGNASVTAACGNAQSQRTVVVIPAGSANNSGLSFEGDSPLSIFLAAGATQLRVSLGSTYDSDNEKTADEDTQWSVISGNEFVSINNTNAKGLLTPLRVGTATIQATYNGQFENLEVQVLQ